MSNNIFNIIPGLFLSKLTILPRTQNTLTVRSEMNGVGRKKMPDTPRVSLWVRGLLIDAIAV